MQVDLDGTQVLFEERDDTALVFSFETIDGAREGTHSLVSGTDAVTRARDRLIDLVALVITS